MGDQRNRNTPGGANGKAIFCSEFLVPAGLEFHSGFYCLLGLGIFVTIIRVLADVADPLPGLQMQLLTQ